jgi:sulfide:quinone oxidoreductase
VVSAVDYFQFVPSNPWVAVGWRTREDSHPEGGPAAGTQGHRFIAKPVTQIDADGSKLVLDAGQPGEDSLAYDYLVITTGPKLSFDEVPGCRPARWPHAFGVQRWTTRRSSGPTTRSS